jgi:hypothetical protein
MKVMGICHACGTAGMRLCSGCGQWTCRFCFDMESGRCGGCVVEESPSLAHRMEGVRLNMPELRKGRSMVRETDRSRENPGRAPRRS